MQSLMLPECIHALWDCYMPALTTITNDDAPADSTRGRANAVRKAYLALAEASIERIALHGDDDKLTLAESEETGRAITTATNDILRAEEALRAHLKAQHAANALGDQAADIITVFAERGWLEGSEGCRYADLPTGRHIVRFTPSAPAPVTIYRMEMGEEAPLSRLATPDEAVTWLDEAA